MLKPILYDHAGRPMASGYRRTGAKRTGSMKDWIPERLQSRGDESLQRHRLAERAIDLINNDANAAGIADNITSVVVGSGLVPHPSVDPNIFPNYTKKKRRKLQSDMRAVYQEWYPDADSGERMTFGAVQYLVKRNLIQYGEYLVLLPMLDREPFSLACQVINPLRLKTPSDKYYDSRVNINDGIELGEYGQPVAYWIKKPEENRYGFSLSDTSDNFTRIPARQGHRWNVLHGFVCQEPEQIRGVPVLASAMKFFKDFSDLLDAELVSSIVTAAFAMFVETGNGADPSVIADQFLRDDDDDDDLDDRYQEITPGSVMYGGPGEKPTVIAANRPGITFDPFVKIVKKALSMAVNIPYPVLFKDTEGVNYAGFRSAMLDAWRVYMMDRVWLGQGFCQKIFTMLQEEAYIRGRLDIDDFYANMRSITRSEWRGSPKGDIEPVKSTKADILAVEAHLKTRAECITERGGDLVTTVEQLQEEEELLVSSGLKEKGT